jgi:lipopolysaccharide/colanic/teichoic acid biosynthesis glycosyltransferase
MSTAAVVGWGGMQSAADNLEFPITNGGNLQDERLLPRPRLLAISHREASRASANRERVRRMLNLFVAIVGLIVTAPLLIVIGLLVKLTSSGPILYRQTRVGVDRRRSDSIHWRRRVNHGGKLFTIYKFRTMYVNQSNAAEETWAKPNDPRVTPLGRVLRKTRLDELPQLYNVLRGDMNVVGPRPEQPQIFQQLRERIDRYPERQRILPGITGWAQINLQYDQDVDDVRRKVKLDLEYAARQSAMEDLRIMMKTVPVMFFRGGGW